MANEIYIQLTSDLPEEALRVKVVLIEEATQYAACDKNESLLSILKRCIVLQDDGTYALQVYMT